MVMDPERNMAFSIGQAKKRVHNGDLKPGAREVSPCTLERIGVSQCLNRIRGHTCPVQLKKGAPPNKDCEEFVGKCYTADDS